MDYHLVNIGFRWAPSESRQKQYKKSAHLSKHGSLASPAELFERLAEFPSRENLSLRQFLELPGMMSHLGTSARGAVLERRGLTSQPGVFSLLASWRDAE